MNNLFLFIYRQPLALILLCMLLLVFLWGYLARRVDCCLLWRLGNAALAAAMLAVIFYMTVYTRGESAVDVALTPFHSFREAKLQPELYRSMLMNVFLFVPLGLTLPFALGKGRLSEFFAVAAALCFCAAIELLQYRYALGRCEIDDVIMNTLGALIGTQAHRLCRLWPRILIRWYLLKEKLRKK